MQLTLIRHGEAAVVVNQNDEKRPLTERGHQQAKQTAVFIQSKIQPDVFVVSPLLRAQQTLQHLQGYFPNVPVVVCDTIKPDDDAKTAIEWLSYLSYESIVVVCHMNVVAYMDAKLLNDQFDPFQLAEVRIYEQAVIAMGLSTLQQKFIPTV